MHCSGLVSHDRLTLDVFYLTGFSQGLRRMSGGMGNLLGPLWAGALIHKPSIMVGVMVALMLMGLVSLHSYKILVKTTLINFYSKLW